MFTNIFGHGQITDYLQRLIEMGDLPSCLLFHGPPGVGKRTTAIEVAKRLNCTGTREAGCSCSSCHKIDSGNHLDVMDYVPDGQTFKIDQVRDLINESNRARMEGDVRVFLLNDAHRLGIKAADALLKTLEDGRDNTLFILLSTSKTALVPTLVSRSLDFYFGALSDDAVRSVLESKGHRGAGVDHAVRLGGGSISKTLYFLEGEGLQLRNDVLALLSEYPHIKDFRVITKVNGYSDQIGEFLETLYVLLSDLCLVERGLTDFVQNQDILEQLSGLKNRFGPKCFNAFSLVRAVRHRQEDPIAIDHHVKSVLLDLKDEFRT